MSTPGAATHESTVSPGWQGTQFRAAALRGDWSNTAGSGGSWNLKPAGHTQTWLSTVHEAIIGSTSRTSQQTSEHLLKLAPVWR